MVPSCSPPPHDEGRRVFPSSWRRDRSQFTGSYIICKYHFGLTTVQWKPFKEGIWSVLERPLKERDSDLVSELGAMALGNIEACCRSFYGYLVKVRGMGVKQANDVRHLLDPRLLNAYWVFMATPQSKGGRGSARDTMRLMCNSMMHILLSCRVLKLRGVQPDDSPTPRRILKWWKKTAQPLCRRCPIGPRKGKARGDGKLWPRFQVRVDTNLGRCLMGQCMVGLMSLGRSMLGHNMLGHIMLGRSMLDCSVMGRGMLGRGMLGSSMMGCCALGRSMLGLCMPGRYMDMPPILIRALRDVVRS